MCRRTRGTLPISEFGLGRDERDGQAASSDVYRHRRETMFFTTPPIMQMSGSTTPLVMRFLEEYAAACASGGTIFGQNARTLYEKTTLRIMPMVNPDGVDLVTGELESGPFYEQARSYSGNYPDIRFPLGWKANINGVDLNLQYPAGWENARDIKFSQGYTQPGPRDYVARHRCHSRKAAPFMTSPAPMIFR